MLRLALALFFCSATARADIAYLNGVTASTSAAGPASSLTTSYTTAGGSSEALILAMHDFVYAPPTSITWNGIPFTNFATVAYAAGSYYGSSLWYAAIGSPGVTTANLVITFAGAEGQPLYSMAEYSGVNQSTVLLNGVTNTTTSGQTINLSVSTSNSNSWIVSMPNWSNPITITSTTGTLNLRQSSIGNEAIHSAQRNRIYDETALTPGTYGITYGLSVGTSFSTYYAAEMKAAPAATAAFQSQSVYDIQNGIKPFLILDRRP